MRSRGLQRTRGGQDGRDRLRRRRPDAVIREGCHSQPGDRDVGGSAERHRRDVRVHPVGARDDRQQDGQVVDAAGHRPELGQGFEDAAEPRRVSGSRHAAARRLEAGDAADVGGLADAVAGVAADIERRSAGRDDRAGATAAATGRPREVVRVRGATEDEIVCLVRPRELGRVGLADEDPARRPETADDGGVPLRDPAGPADRPGRRD